MVNSCIRCVHIDAIHKNGYETVSGIMLKAPLDLPDSYSLFYISPFYPNEPPSITKKMPTSKLVFKTSPEYRRFYHFKTSPILTSPSPMHHAPCAIHAPRADSTSIHVLAPRHHAPVLRQRPEGALRGHQLTQWGTERTELLGASPGDHATGAPWEGDLVPGGWMHIFCSKNQDSTICI